MESNMIQQKQTRSLMITVVTSIDKILNKVDYKQKDPLFVILYVPR